MKKSGNKIHYYDFGKFRLDVTNRELLKNGTHVALTQKSFELLEFLIENRGRGLRKNEILNDIWTENFVEEANLAQHIYMVRKALKDNGDTENYIETIPKYGYRFIGEITEEFVDALPPQSYKKLVEEKAPEPANGFDKHLAPEIANEFGDPDQELTDIKPPSLRAKNMQPAKIFGGVLAAAVLLSLAAYFFFFASPRDSNISDIKSIAILPFSQIGDSPDQKLGLGIADTLISRLGNQQQISVSPTSTIIKFIEKGTTDNPIEIGEKLGVEAILTGTIQRENETVRVNVQLISVKNKTPVWSDKFDAPFSNIFALQDRISEQVANKLSLNLGKTALTERENRYTENIEAYEAYTMGLFYWDKRSEENLPKAIAQFEKAIEKDPQFSSAYALAADAYSLIGYYQFQTMPANDAIEKARQMANKALELDPKSSEAYAALGIVALYEKKPEKAKPLYRKALELKPNNATARQRLAWMLTTNENLDEAISEMRLAQRADPISTVTNLNLTRLLRLNREPDQALIFCNRALDMDPSSISAKIFLAEIYEQKEDYGKAKTGMEGIIRQFPNDTESKLILSRIKAKMGDKKKARELLDKSLLAKDVNNSPYELATAFLFLGQKDKAIETLKTAKANTLIHYLHVKYDPNLDEIRKTKAYDTILTDTKERLDPAYK